MSNKKGFTLIEVIVVTLIIAALALLVAPSFKNSTITNDMEKAKMGLVEFTNAAKLYNEVHPSAPISGTFDSIMYSKLAYDGNEGFAYLQNTGNRWHQGQGSNYTLLNLDCVFSFNIGDTSSMANTLSMAKCKFEKPNGAEGKDCYWFSIKKSNPMIIDKDIKEEGDCVN